MWAPAPGSLRCGRLLEPNPRYRRRRRLSRCLPPAQTQLQPPPAAAATSSRRPPPPLSPPPRRPHPSFSRARPPQTLANKTHHSQLHDPRRACATHQLAEPLGCSETRLLPQHNLLALACPRASQRTTAQKGSAPPLATRSGPADPFFLPLSGLPGTWLPSQPRRLTPDSNLNSRKLKSLRTLHTSHSLGGMWTVH